LIDGFFYWSFIMEEWRTIEWNCDYMVSNTGKIKSLKKKKEIILKPSRTHKGKGYHMVILCKNGERSYKTIHRLVAIAFIPNPENKPQVNHIDGNTINNSVENLEWCTPSENEIHSFRKLGRISPTKGLFGKYSANPKSVYQIDIKTNKIIMFFDSVIDASIKMKIDKTSISRCCRKEKGTAGGYKWQYAKKEKKA